MNKVTLCGMLVAACAMNGVALAHDYGHDHMNGWHGSGRMMVMGRHWMEGKVESVDHKTGWVKVKTAEGDLTVHFPAESVKDLKEGETITVHLSYTKGEMKKPGAMMEKSEKPVEKPAKDGGTMK